MRAIRPALALAAVLGVGLASAASAAGGPSTLTFADKKGDNVSPSAASDITGVSWTTSGKNTGAKYVAKNLVLTLTLAAPPAADGMVVYGIDADLAGCGDFYVSYMPGAKLLDSFNYASCGGNPSDPTGDGTSFDGSPEVKGTSIIWTFPLKSLPGDVKAGSQFTAVNAYTDFVDPATSIFGPRSLTGEALYDTATTDKPYKVG